MEGGIVFYQTSQDLFAIRINAPRNLTVLDTPRNLAPEQLTKGGFMRSNELRLFVVNAFLCSAVIAFAPALVSCIGSGAPGTPGTHQSAATIEAKAVPGEI